MGITLHHPTRTTAMMPQPNDFVPKWILGVLNNLFEIEKKIGVSSEQSNLKRNVERMKELFADQNIFFENPMGEKFSETRTDLEATITGTGTNDLRVTDVIKPIIRVGSKALSRVVQKGIVVVESTQNKSETGESNV
jgi:hypothetical protein